MIEKLSNLNEFKMKTGCNYIGGGIQDKIIILDFTAQWCGPCQRIAPFFEELSNDNKYLPKCLFYKVDIDESEDISTYCEISSMPTFQFYLNGEKIDELVGANKDELVNKINSYIV